MKYRSIDISGRNIEQLFFHYTNINNIDSIFEYGLIPKIGKNSNFIEKSEKVFFTKGSKGILVLMDVWIKWLVLRPRSDFVYGTGAYLMQKKWFPKIIIDILWKNWIKSEKRIKKACKKLNGILNESVFLNLSLENGVDYKENDFDEVKLRSFRKSWLDYIYSYDEGLTNKKMDYWNMHTLTEKVIESSKIKVVKVKNKTNANEVLKYIIKNSNYDLKKLPFLNIYKNMFFISNKKTIS